MIDSANTFLGIPIDFKGRFKVYPPSIRDTLANPNFKQYLSLFTISQEDIEDQIFSMDDETVIQEGQIPTPYQYIVEICKMNEVYLNLIKEGFNFFTKEELSFIPEKDCFLLGNLEDILMNIKSLDELPILDPNDFFEFQNAIRAAMGEEILEPYNYNLHPKVRRMKAKARYRDRVKAKQNSKKGGLIDSLAAICCMGIGLTPLNIGEMSYAAISVITTKYQKKEKYDLDIRSLLAGADSKKVKPKYWMSEEDK